VFAQAKSAQAAAPWSRLMVAYSPFPLALVGWSTLKALDFSVCFILFTGAWSVDHTCTSTSCLHQVLRACTCTVGVW
jgi:hypothetical protein